MKIIKVIEISKVRSKRCDLSINSAADINEHNFERFQDEVDNFIEK